MKSSICSISQEDNKLSCKALALAGENGMESWEWESTKLPGCIRLMRLVNRWDAMGHIAAGINRLMLDVEWSFRGLLRVKKDDDDDDDGGDPEEPRVSLDSIWDPEPGHVLWCGDVVVSWRSGRLPR